MPHTGHGHWLPLGSVGSFRRTGAAAAQVCSADAPDRSGQEEPCAGAVHRRGRGHGGGIKAKRSRLIERTSRALSACEAALSPSSADSGKAAVLAASAVPELHRGQEAEP